MLRCLLALALLLPALAVAQEPKVIVADRFEQKLGPGWTWLREDKPAWRLGASGLEIRVQPSAAHNVKNALVRPAPDRSKTAYCVEVTVERLAPPTNQFEQGGITLYVGEKPVFKLVHELIDGKTYIIPGRVPAPAGGARLRLSVEGEKFTAEFRASDQARFQVAASGKLPPPGADERISLQCYQGPADAEHWIRFSDFRIVQAAGR